MLLMMVVLLMEVVVLMIAIIMRTAMMGTKVTKHLEHIEEELAIVLTELPEEDQQLLVEVNL